MVMVNKSLVSTILVLRVLLSFHINLTKKGIIVSVVN